MDSQKHLDLGSWVGLQNAFANVSSGPHARRLGFTWDEFCTLHAGISRRHADNLIQYERFGDAYFRLTQIAPVSPKTFQQIAAQVTPGTIEIEGQPLALTPENAPRVGAALQSLRRQLQHPSNDPSNDPRPPAHVVELRVRLDALPSDAAKAFHALNPVAAPELESASLRGFAAYGLDRFRALSRDFGAKP